MPGDRDLADRHRPARAPGRSVGGRGRRGDGRRGASPGGVSAVAGGGRRCVGELGLLGLELLLRSFWAWVVWMPVPHSWYTTNSRIRTPAADHEPAHRAEPSCERHAGTIVSRADRRRSAPRLGRPRHRHQVPSVIPMEPVVHLRAAVSLLGRFPALAGVDLDVDRGRDRAAPGPERGRQDHAAAHAAPGCCRWSRAPRSCWATTCATTAGRCGARSACSATPPCSTTSSPWPTTCASGPGPPGPTGRRRRRHGARSGLDGRLRDVRGRPAVGRPAPPGLASPCMVARRPELWLLDEPHAGLDADGPRPGRRAGPRGRGRRAPPCVVASHELERADALAGRGRSRSSAGIVTGRRRRPPPTAPPPDAADEVARVP